MSSDYPDYTATQHIAEGKRLLADARGSARGSYQWEGSETDRLIQAAQAHFGAAQAIAAVQAVVVARPHDPVDNTSDEELWNSPLGERVRHYADRLLLAEDFAAGPPAEEK